MGPKLIQALTTLAKALQDNPEGRRVLIVILLLGWTWPLVETAVFWLARGR